MDAEQANSRSSQSANMVRCSPVICNSNPLMGDFVSEWSPLHDAAIHGHLISVNQLINQGFSVNQITADNVSPLHEACLGGHSACAKLLLKRGAQVNLPNIDWRTPIFNACVSGSVACLNALLQHGASPSAMCDVASPIHEAAKRGYTECVESLSKAGANIQHCIKHLGSPLYMACKNQKVETAKKLLELGASANLGKDSDSPLHVAARTANVDLVNLLIDFGGDTQLKNAERKRPSELVQPNCPLSHVFHKREGPQSLKQICRLCIRKCLGQNQHHRISELPIPDMLRCFLLYR